MPCCKFHDRLDLKLSVHEYTAAACGSLSLPQAGDNTEHGEGKPHYCCFECPTLLAKLAK